MYLPIKLAVDVLTLLNLLLCGWNHILGRQRFGKTDVSISNCLINRKNISVNLKRNQIYTETKSTSLTFHHVPCVFVDSLLIKWVKQPFQRHNGIA